MIGIVCFLKSIGHIIFMPRAYTDGTGLTVRFSREDRPLLENGGEVKINLQDYPNQTLEIYVVDKISEKVKRIKKSGFLTEPWVRTVCYPPGPPEKRNGYKIWLEKSAARNMLEQNEPPLGDGYLDTRCSYDRLHMSYWGSTRQAI